jgi:hypothetical protein
MVLLPVLAMIAGPQQTNRRHRQIMMNVMDFPSVKPADGLLTAAEDGLRHVPDRAAQRYNKHLFRSSAEALLLRCRSSELANRPPNCVYASGFGGIIRPMGPVGVAITSSCCAIGVHHLVLQRISPKMAQRRPLWPQPDLKLSSQLPKSMQWCGAAAACCDGRGKVQKDEVEDHSHVLGLHDRCVGVTDPR